MSNHTEPVTVERLDVPLDLIDPDPDNRSTELDDAFVESVRQHGVLNPILLKPTDDGRYRLIAGERRYLAAGRAGLATIPATVRQADEQTAAVWQAVENLHRQDLNPSEEARQVARIMAAGMRQKALAAALNKPLSWVRARLALVALPVEVQAATDAGVFEPSDALTFAKHADRADVIDAVLHDNYRSGSDLAWRLQRAERQLDAEAAYVATVARCVEAGWTVHEGPDPATAYQGTKRLNHIGLYGDEADAHQAETCHLVTISRGSGDPQVVAWCTAPKRHRAQGASPIKTPARPKPDTNDAERERVKAERAAKAHRAAFAVEAINARLRSRDLTEFVLPVLFDTAGQTELTAAAKLLGIEPVQAAHGGHKDHATPLREWAAESTSNLTRAMLAVAYSLAAERAAGGVSWSTVATDALTAWLDSLGYQPETSDE